MWDAVSSPVKRVVEVCKCISNETKSKLSWNIRRAMFQLLAYGEIYLSSAKKFIETGKADHDKLFSFHLSEVACFNKNKEHKKYEFGSAFQIGRIAGNILFIGKCTSIRMEDKESLVPMVEEHEKNFGPGIIESVATDKGYYSNKNVKILADRKIKQIGIQVPGNIKNKNIKLSDEQSEKLCNRRAGIEPLIGHAKHGGQLGRSRMKNDKNIESSGYCAILGFNLRQTTRALNRLNSERCVNF